MFNIRFYLTLLTSLFFLSLFVFVSADEGLEISKSNIEYTPTSETSCFDGVCNKVLYSGTRNVYEDKRWKRIEDARSLKNSGIECLVDSDEKNLVECIDWNLTSISLKLEQDSVSIFNRKVPLKVYSMAEDGIYYIKSEVDFNFNLFSNSKEEDVSDFNYGDIIHFGEKSTTIKLSDANTDIMDDAEVFSQAPHEEQGADDNLDILVDYKHIISRVNLSEVPVASTILDSTFCMYLETNDLDDGTEGFNVSSHLIYYNFTCDGLEWTEGDSTTWTFASNGEIAWGTRPNSSYYSIMDDDLFFDGTASTGFHCWDYTDSVGYAIDNGHLNVSLYLLSHDKYGLPAGNDDLRFHSKEHTTSAQRPYMNITYTENPSAEPPVTVLDYPVNNNVTEDYGVITFGCSGTDNLVLNNVTWYLWNSTDNLDNSSLKNWSGTTNSSSFTHNFTYEDSYVWNCLVYDNDSNSDWGSNFTFNLTIPPVITLNIIDPVTEDPDNYTSGSNYTIKFLLDSEGTNITAGISVNNITINGTQANVVQSGSDSQSPLDFETFTSDLGNWYTYYLGADAGCIWEQDTDGTTSSRTGPCGGDGTCDTDDAGFDDNEYAYVETSSADCNTDNSAFLQFNDTDMDTYGNINFTFAYSMYGADVGNLSFQIDDGVGGWDVLWSLDGNQGSSPEYVEISLMLGSYSGERDIRFEYDRNGHTGYLGDVAVDVLNVTDVGGLKDEFSWIEGSGWNVNITAPVLDNGTLDLIINISYSGVNYNATELLSIIYGSGGSPPSDSCTCGSGSNWEIDMTDFCTLSSSCVPLAVTFINSGNFTCNAELNVSSLEGLESGQIGYLGSSCLMYER